MGGQDVKAQRHAARGTQITGIAVAAITSKIIGALNAILLAGTRARIRKLTGPAGNTLPLTQIDINPVHALKIVDLLNRVVYLNLDSTSHLNAIEASESCPVTAIKEVF
jgi:uncharacterized protein (DUF4213/DUF364 family)